MNEPLHGLVIQDKKLKISVTNKGYTTSGSLRVDVVSGFAGFMVTIVRIEEDMGKMMPQVVELEFPLPDEIGNEQFTVQNQFTIPSRI